MLAFAPAGECLCEPDLAGRDLSRCEEAGSFIGAAVVAVAAMRTEDPGQGSLRAWVVLAPADHVDPWAVVQADVDEW